MGGPDASLSGHGRQCGSDSWGRPMSLVLVFTYVQYLHICFQGWCFGMFCLFRAALLSASPAVYWLEMVSKRKGDLLGGKPFGCALLPALLANCARSVPWTF